MPKRPMFDKAMEVVYGVKLKKEVLEKLRVKYNKQQLAMMVRQFLEGLV
ncbi:MAG: hypothetical protein ACPLKS_07490 [Caldisericum exile]